MSFSYAGVGSVLFRGGILGNISHSYKTEQRSFYFTNTTANVTLTAADLSNGYNVSYNGSSLSSSGTGVSHNGGFNVGSHVRTGSGFGVGYSNASVRQVEYDLDLTGVEEITFRLVMGNGSNGGETPDGNEDLWMRFLDTGLSNADASRKLLDNTETTYTSPGNKTVTVPVEARRSNQRVRIYQLSWTGTTEFDHYGFISITLDQTVSTRTATTTFVPGTTNVFEYLDFGGVSSDYWVLQNYQNTVLSTIQNDQIINLTETGGTISMVDYGSLTEIEAVGIEDWGSITVNSDVTPFGFTHFHSLATWSVIKTWIGSGTVFEFGGSRYRLDAPYIVSGTLRVSGSANDHYVPAIATEGLLPLRSDTKIAYAPNWNAFGTLFSGSFAGEAVVKISPEDRKTLFNVHGDAGISFRPNWVGSGVLFNISTTTFKQTYDYVGEGTLFSVSSTEEAVVWDYNNSSIDYFTYENFGSVAGQPIESISLQSVANETIQSLADDKIIDLVVSGSVSGAFLDFGTILTDGEQTPSTVGLDWGEILTNQTDYPFGLFPIGGTAKQVFTPNFIGSGVLFAFGEGRGRTKPRWIAFVNIGISGVAKTNFSLLHKGSGNLFSFNSSEDSRAYVYSGSGALYAFSGAAESVGADYPDSTALLPITGAAGVSFRPNWNGSGVATLAGASVERQTDHYQGSGTLFNFETAKESITYHYSSTSNDIFGHRNYGSVASVPIESITLQSIANETLESRKDDKIIDLVISGSTSGSYLDYGAILLNGEDAPETVREDYGSITESISRYAMGDFLVQGEAATIRARNYIGTGGLFAFVSGIGRTKPRWIANIQIDVTGKGDTPRARSFAGEGVLFNLQTADERRSYGYQSTGTLYAVNGAAEVFGANPPDITTNLQVSGSADVAFVPNWNGSGTATVFGQAIERAAVNPPARGSLFGFSNADDRRAYSYNQSSTDLYIDRDYGFVSSAVIDSWVLANHASKVLEDYKNDKLIDLIESGGGDQNYLNYGFIETANIAGLPGANNLPDAREDYGTIIDPLYERSIYPMGRLFKITGKEVRVVINLRHIAVLDKPTLKIGGEVSVRLPNKQDGSGTLFTTTGTAYAEKVSFSPDPFFTLFDFTGRASVKATIVESGFAHLSTSGTTDPENLTFVESVDGEIILSGKAGIVYTPNWNGSGSISTFSGAAESRTTKLVDLHGLYDFVGAAAIRSTVFESGFARIKLSGTTEPEILTFAEQPFGTATIFGQSTSRFASIYKGSGRISTLSGAAEAVTFNPLEKNLLFSVTGRATESFTFGSYDTEGSIVLSNVAVEARTFVDIASGTISTSGVADVVDVNVYRGEGNIFSRGLVSESITKTLPAFTVHLDFVGVAKERATFREVLFGSLFKFNGTSGPILRTFAEEPQTLGRLNGVAATPRARDFIGSGAIFSNGISSEAITRKLPEFTAHLNVTGLAEERATFREVLFGSLFTFRGSTTPEILTFAEQPSVEIDVLGIADIARTRIYLGSGRISTLSGAAEAVTFNPLERDLLFDVTGIAAERRTNSFVGTGQIRIYPEAADIRFTPNWNVEGVIPVSGIAGERVARDEVVRILIGTFSGAAESVTFNPLEKDALFSFTGRASIRSAVSEVKQVEVSLFAEPAIVKSVAVPPPGEGTATISGIGGERSARDYIGQILIGTFSGAAESITVNPLERQLLFSATGLAIQKVTRSYVGTGNLYAIGGASESRAVVPPTEGLYDISGEARIVITLSHVGDGNLFGFVSAQEAVAYDYTGEQVLFSVSGTAEESITRREEFFGSIFSFSGAAERVAYVPSLFADVNLSGVAATPRARAYQGFGDLPLFAGAAESRTITYENVAIFDFLGQVKPAITKVHVGEAEIKVSGEAQESFIRAPYSGQTEVQFSGTADERTTANPPEEGTEITTDGEAKVLRTFAHQGSGTIKVNGDTIIGISLRIFGSGAVSVYGKAKVQALLSHKPDVHILLEGQATTARIQVAPARTYGWII